MTHAVASIIHIVRNVSHLKKNEYCIEGQVRWLVQWATGTCGKCTVEYSALLKTGFGVSGS
jgi:hypothetical protein